MAEGWQGSRKARWVKLLLPLLGAAGLGLGALLPLAPPASAERPGASATATAHALDELANAIARARSP